MAEAIISRRGYGIEGKPPTLVTNIFTTNTNWTVPNLNNQVFDVRIFGGGGGGIQGPTTTYWERLSTGGGGGWMNNDIMTLPAGSTIRITIGAGGKGAIDSDGSAGGTTSFGTYLSANGGRGGSTGSESDGGGEGGAVP